MPPYRMVVFDIGGVMCRITHDWREAARHAGVATRWDLDDPKPISAFLPLDAYQIGSMDLDSYLDALAEWAGCPKEDALRIHNAILVEEYPGVEELVRELQANGVRTGCLSNTNAAHWVDLTSSRFPAIVMLDCRMASHDVGLAKPDPAIFRHFAETNGVRPAEIVFFDDNEPNVEAANRAGFRAHRVDPAGDPVAQIRAFLRWEEGRSE